MPPLKRHKALVRFSREHNFGLLLGWKVRQGVSKNIEADRMADYILASCDAEIMPHFDNEEKELFSLLREDDPMRTQAEKEHFDIRRKLDELKTEATVEKLLGFTKMLDEHIRFEERKLFPYIEQQQSFEVYAKAMEAHDTSPHAEFDATWEDKFWK